MQRGFPEDFDSWAALGNDEWSYDKVLPYFRKSERDLDIQDNIAMARTDRCRSGAVRPVPGPPSNRPSMPPACRRGSAPRTTRTACIPAGLGVSPSNNIDGVRMSTAMTHLNPVRHHLNLTVRGGVFVRKIVIRDGEAVGVEAESGGKVFHVEADRVVLSAGAIRSPHLAHALRHRPRGPTAAIRHTDGLSSARRRPEPVEPPQRPDDLQGQGRHLARRRIPMRRISACTTPPKGRTPSTTWCCGPARSSTNGRSASPACGPST